LIGLRNESFYRKYVLFSDKFGVFFSPFRFDRQLAILPAMDNPASLSKRQIQSLRTLRKKSGRYEQGQFVVEGHRAVMQVLQNSVLQIRFLIVTAAYLEVMREKEPDIIKETFSGESCPVYQIGERVFQQLAGTDSAQGVLAVCHLPRPAATNILLERTGILLAADRIRDPGNLGTMVRTAVWFGLKGLILSEGTADLFHPKVVRSTAGATGVLPWLETNLLSFLEQASKQGWKVHLLDSGPGSVSHLTANPTGRDILVAGNEAGGLAGEIRNAGYPCLRIDPAWEPVPGTSSPAVESLNASVASAIVMAHFCQCQRNRSAIDLSSG
jgi:RNA methyltransferase, TrmH family